MQLADMLADNPEIEFTVFYPQHDSLQTVEGKAGNIRYAGFYEEAIPELQYNPGMTERIKAALDKIQPDIVHIWGSEYVHTLSMTRAFNKPEKTVISIQGLIHRLGEVYTEGLPDNIIKRHTFRDLIRKDSIAEQKEKFLKRGECELAALKEVKHVIGRTGWDREAVLSVNPGLIYHHAGEILRKEFYDTDRKWSPENADRHRIFMSQSYYPIKGIHFALNALRTVKERYPDVKLVVTGKDMRPKTLKECIKQDSYGKYISELIKKYSLEDNIEFTGPQNPDNMVKQYLKCSVFLLPSVMENSSNSLGEAMMLGVPCIVAATGGTSDMIQSDEGWLYDCTNTSVLAEKITEAFRYTDSTTNDGKNKLGTMLEKASEHAHSAHDRKTNLEAYLGVYRQITDK